MIMVEGELKWITIVGGKEGYTRLYCGGQKILIRGEGVILIVRGISS